MSYVDLSKAPKVVKTFDQQREAASFLCVCVCVCWKIEKKKCMYKTLLSQRTAAEQTRRSFIDPLLLLHISSCWHSCRLQMKTILFLVVVFFFASFFLWNPGRGYI